MPARAFSQGAARASAPTRASPCGPTAPAASTSTPASRPSARAARRRSRKSAPRSSASTTKRSRVHAGDSAASPLNTGAFASRTLIAAAGAIREAADALRGKTLRIAAMVLQSTPEALEVSGRVVRVADEPGRSRAARRHLHPRDHRAGDSGERRAGSRGDRALRALARGVLLRHRRRRRLGRSRERRVRRGALRHGARLRRRRQSAAGRRPGAGRPGAGAGRRAGGGASLRGRARASS